MKRVHWALLGVTLALAALIVELRVYLGDEGGAAVAMPATGLRAPGSLQLPPAGVPAPAPALASGPVADAPLPPLPASTEDAGDTMRQALEHGDPATPPLHRDAAGEAPTAAELADPAAHQRYEARQNQRLYNEYVKAAGAVIPRLQDDIIRARAAALPPEQIAEGEEKLRRIQAMQAQLQASQGGTPSP